MQFERHIVEAVSFDLWDTLIVDESDEAKRAKQGLDPKPLARRKLVWEFLNRHEPVERSLVDAVYDAADYALKHVWHELYVTWPVRRRLEIVLAGLGRSLPDEEFDELVRLHETMEMDIGVDMVKGAVEALSALKKRYKLAVISDAVITPGWALRKILEGHGLAEFFDAMIFSDEVGHSKPHPDVFLAAAEALGTSPRRMVHVGDRGTNDVEGIQAAGGRAVLFTGVADRGRGVKPEAVCESLTFLPGIIKVMAKS